MKAARIERMLDELERVGTHVTKLADRIEPERTRGLCIGTSRMAMLGLRDVGVRAEALAVELRAMNPAYVAMMIEAERNGRQPTAADVAEASTRGAWCIQIGPATTNDIVPRDIDRRGFAGHVIVAVERRWIIDLTLGQASRPDHGIPLPPTAWADCPPLARRQTAALFELDGGVHLTYEPIDDRAYLNAHDWKHLRPGEPSVRNLGKRLRDAADGRTPAPMPGLRDLIGGTLR